MRGFQLVSTPISRFFPLSGTLFSREIIQSLLSWTFLGAWFTNIFSTCFMEWLKNSRGKNQKEVIGDKSIFVLWNEKFFHPLSLNSGKFIFRYERIFFRLFRSGNRDFVNIERASTKHKKKDYEVFSLLRNPARSDEFSINQ